MANRYVGLIRGINVGKAKRVAMSDLRALLEERGYTDVRTLLNSGNVVFSGARGDAKKIAAALERAMETDLKVAARVVVLTGEHFRLAVEENPLTKMATDPTRFIIAFLLDRADAKHLAPLTRKDWKPEALAVGTHAAYLWCPDGFMESPLRTAVGEALDEATTTRNWATVLKIAAVL
jgi:uncharacterized protein (DUF1697 family)